MCVRTESANVFTHFVSNGHTKTYALMFLVYDDKRKLLVLCHFYVLYMNKGTAAEAVLLF